MQEIATEALDRLIPPGEEAGRRWGFALADGRVLVLAAEDVGMEEGITLSLHAADGTRLARLSRRLWLGDGFVGAPVPDGPAALRFTFPDGIAWRARVNTAPGWLQRLGLGPLMLRRVRP